MHVPHCVFVDDLEHHLVLISFGPLAKLASGPNLLPYPRWAGFKRHNTLYHEAVGEGRDNLGNLYKISGWGRVYGSTTKIGRAHV